MHSNSLLKKLAASALTAVFAPVLHAAITADFEVFPADVNLKFMRDSQSMVVRITEPNGVHRDVTAEAKFTVADPVKAKVEKGVIFPLADGETKVKIEWNGKSAEVPLKVEQAATDTPISFRLDVMPVFMKAGCNTGGCHGSARGKDGFNLSLFGYDPEGDHYRLTRELPGRRVNLALPDESMLSQKTSAPRRTRAANFSRRTAILRRRSSAGWKLARRTTTRRKWRPARASKCCQNHCCSKGRIRNSRSPSARTIRMERIVT